MWLPANFSVVQQHISRIERNWNLHILQFTNIFMFRFDFFMLVIVFENRTELILVPVVQRFFVVIVVVAASRFRQIRWYLVEFCTRHKSIQLSIHPIQRNYRMCIFITYFV